MRATRLTESSPLVRAEDAPFVVVENLFCSLEGLAGHTVFDQKSTGFSLQHQGVETQGPRGKHIYKAHPRCVLMEKHCNHDRGRSIESPFEHHHQGVEDEEHDSISGTWSQCVKRISRTTFFRQTPPAIKTCVYHGSLEEPFCQESVPRWRELLEA